MPNVAIVGYGAMARYVADQLKDSPWTLSDCICREGREDVASASIGEGPNYVLGLDDMSALPDLVVDCAGHEGLRAHAADFLSKGVPVISASLGALADPETYKTLSNAAAAGNTQLKLVSGALGSLDALSAAKIGGLEAVTYRGSKPPKSWKGSPAETLLDLDALDVSTVFFDGTAADAALQFPKNANVAAAVALAGVGFEKTTAQLVADPNAEGNTHTVTARGAFGEFEFTIVGNGLVDSPRTSALAAMAIVERIFRQTDTITVI